MRDECACVVMVGSADGWRREGWRRGVWGEGGGVSGVDGPPVITGFLCN